MQTVTMDEAKAQLPELLEAAAESHLVLRVSNGQTKTFLVSVETMPDQLEHARPIRKAGFMAGEFTVPDDFDTMFSKEILQMFGIEE